MWKRTSSACSSALAIALLGACSSGTERPQASMPDTAAHPGINAAFGDSALPDTVSSVSPHAVTPPSNDAGRGGDPRGGDDGGTPPGGGTVPAGQPTGVASTWDTAPAPVPVIRPGVVDTELQGPAAPGVVDTAVAGPAIGPHTIRRPSAGTLDTAAVVAPSRRGALTPARPLPGVHR
jgi:hypothetical protein